MTYDVEVLLKGTDEVVTEQVTHDGPDPAGWTDADVREVLLSALRVFERVTAGESAAGTVALRGLSWIVTEVSPGVAINIEIPSGAIAAGPFDLSAAELTQMLTRVIASGGGAATVH